MVVIKELRQRFLDGYKRPLLTAPTRWGKGFVCAWQIRRAVAKGNRVLFLVNRRNIVHDQSRRLDALGLDHGIIMGGHKRRKPWLKVHIASIDTLYRREIVPKADLLYIDEAHFAISPTWEHVLARYPEAAVIGMTATPERLDGRGLGHIFDCMVHGPTVAEATEAKRLVPARVYAPSTPDLSSVHVRAGDFQKDELAAIMDKPKLVGDITEHWLKHGRGRPTIGFAVSVKNSKDMMEAFRAAGVRTTHVDASTPDEGRDDAWDGLASGKYEVVWNVGLASYGWDCGAVACLIDAQPTMSLTRHLQMHGRVLTPFAGKEDALILDHAGNTLRHGFVDDDRDWSLADKPKTKRKKDDPAPSVCTCGECWAAFRSSRRECPYCGWVRPLNEREVAHEDGELQEVKRVRRVCRQCHRSFSIPEGVRSVEVFCPKCGSVGTVVPPQQVDKQKNWTAKEQFWERIRQTAQQRGYADKWPRMQFKFRFGYWPSDKLIAALDRAVERKEAVAHPPAVVTPSPPPHQPVEEPVTRPASAHSVNGHARGPAKPKPLGEAVEPPLVLDTKASDLLEDPGDEELLRRLKR
jgi:superfamily II DNA or RNA helicase